MPASSLSPTDLPADSPSAPSRKRKQSGPAGELKRKSCSACHVRKIKCVPADDVGSSTAASTSTSVVPCKNCACRGYTCEYSVGKKLGRPTKAAQLQKQREAEEAAIATGSTPATTPRSTSSPFALPIPTPSPFASTIEASAPSETKPLVRDGLSSQPSPHPSSGLPFAEHEGRPASAFPHPPVFSHRLEDVLSRSTATSILSLFFSYVHALTPCIHRPSFYADFHARREETDPVFFSLLLATLAATLVQVPWSFLPVQQDEVRKLATRCYNASVAASEDHYEPPTSDMVIVLYFHSIYHFTARREVKNSMCFGASVQMAMVLRMHREDSYDGLDPVEAEIRRRVFFLLFISDKIKANKGDRFMTMPSGESRLVGLPAPLDDDCITRTGYLPQPPARVPVILGFRASVSIQIIIGEILELHRKAMREPQTDLTICQHLLEVHRFNKEIDDVPRQLPPEFVVKEVASGENGSPQEGWDEDVKQQIEVFFSDPEAARLSASDSYLGSQAQIWVTVAVARFTLLSLRDRLLDLSGLPGTPSRILADTAAIDPRGLIFSKDAVAVDLLDLMHRLPVHALALNTTYLVDRVRFIASTLLEENKLQNPAIAQYLWDYLQLLDQVESSFATEVD